MLCYKLKVVNVFDPYYTRIVQPAFSAFIFRICSCRPQLLAKNGAEPLLIFLLHQIIFLLSSSLMAVSIKPLIQRFEHVRLRSRYTAPALGWPENTPFTNGARPGLWDWIGRDGPLGQFLEDFGPALIEKYNPKGIVVFSAHWETGQERLGRPSFSSVVYGVAQVHTYSYRLWR